MRRRTIQAAAALAAVGILVGWFSDSQRLAGLARALEKQPVLAQKVKEPLGGQPRIYWGDDVPKEWNGDWPQELKTVPERTGYQRTMTTQELHEWIAALKTKSDNVHSVDMFTSPLKKVAPAMVLANPRVSSPPQARASGKPVVFLQGNIHPPEPEAAEALLMVARILRRAGALRFSTR